MAACLQCEILREKSVEEGVSCMGFESCGKFEFWWLNFLFSDCDMLILFVWNRR